MVFTASFDGNWVEKLSGVERRRESKIEPVSIIIMPGKVEADLHANAQPPVKIYAPRANLERRIRHTLWYLPI